MKPASIRARLIGGTTIWLVVSLIIGGAALSAAFRRSVEAAFVDRLQSLMLAVVGAVDVGSDGIVRMPRDVPHAGFERAYSGWYWQVDDGETRLASRSLWDAVLPVRIADDEAPGITRTIIGPRQQRLRAVVRRLQFGSHPRALTVVVAAPEVELEREVAAFNRLLVMSLGALALVLVGAVALQVVYGLRPLARLGAELDEVRSGRQSRLGGGHAREIEPVVRAMNSVLDQDTRLIERARAVAGNLAHGLKTPLSILSLEASRPNPDGSRIVAQVGRISAVVDHHLARAAAAGSVQAFGTRTEIRPVVLELRSMMLRVHAEKRLSITIEVAADLSFAGERQDLEEMLGNLVENACKWATTRVAIIAVSAGEAVEIGIDDDGTGVDAADTEFAMQRGVRLDKGEPGSGLGLSITADLAQLYGGTLVLDRSHHGGLRVRLRLPRAD